MKNRKRSAFLVFAFILTIYTVVWIYNAIQSIHF